MDNEKYSQQALDTAITDTPIEQTKEELNQLDVNNENYIIKSNIHHFIIKIGTKQSTV